MTLLQLQDVNEMETHENVKQES